MTTVDLRGSGASTLARDFVLLLVRVGLGVMMIAHTKLTYDYGGSIAGVVDTFDKSGVPLAAITGPANLFGELIGGVLLILGFAVRVIGVLMAVNMAGAWFYVHTGSLYAMDHSGPELVIALGLLSLVLAVTGSGRWGLDYLIFGRRRRESATAARSSV
jgi:putative oxidoreductase